MPSIRSLGRAAGSTLCLAVMLPLALLPSVGSVDAATTLVLVPDRATAGTRVTIYNACLGVTDSPPAELRAAFVRSSARSLQPTDPSVARAVAKHRTGPDRYVVVVPELAPGRYDVRLECVPGDWTTNTAEGGATQLSVRAGAPDTSTGSVVTQPESANPFEALLLIAAGIVGALGALYRQTPVPMIS